jgi:hypothetical protein
LLCEEGLLGNGKRWVLEELIGKLNMKISEDCFLRGFGLLLMGSISGLLRCRYLLIRLCGNFGGLDLKVKNHRGDGLADNEEVLRLVLLGLTLFLNEDLHGLEGLE